eukprot:TRINITY_DN865_c7_g1_i1.p1 TRINITY_DN865_c7_g1~~TRINITY_DN865_c7_g1_i1.p1  ORF type:complete len:253 (+),score=65.85 TRINITY_DN865_c7_g1_i1:96-761(+)
MQNNDVVTFYEHTTMPPARAEHMVVAIEDTKEEEASKPGVLFIVALVLMSIGFCLVWTGMYFMVLSVKGATMLIIPGAVALGVGCVMLAFVLDRKKEQKRFFITMVVFLAGCAAVYIGYFIVVVSTDHRPPSDKTDEDDISFLDKADRWGDGVERAILLLFLGCIIPAALGAFMFTYGFTTACMKNAEEKEEVHPADLPALPEGGPVHDYHNNNNSNPTVV